MRFIATASVACASVEIEPSDIAPVAKRLTISAGGLDLVQRHRPAGIEAELEQAAAQRHVAARLVVDDLRVFLVRLESARRPARTRAGLGDRVGRPHVLASRTRKAYSPPASEPSASSGRRRTRRGAADRLLGDLEHADAADLARRAGEVLVDEASSRQADRLEHLRAAVRL